MFGFFKKDKNKRESSPPPFKPAPVRPDDDLARTADLVQKTGDCAKADGDGMILMFRSGILQPQEFFPGFLKSEIFFLVKDTSNLNEPLFLVGPDGAARLAIFTSPERGQPIQKKHPEFRYAVKVPCRAVLAGLPPGVGLVMNAESEAVTFQMAPEQFARFKADFIR